MSSIQGIYMQQQPIAVKEVKDWFTIILLPEFTINVSFIAFKLLVKSVNL